MLAKEQETLQSTIETIYRVNADDYVRAELEAREDELRVQRTLDNEMKRRLEKLAEQQQTITEQQNKIAVQQNTIIAQQNTIDTQQNTIAELQAEIAQLKALEAK